MSGRGWNAVVGGLVGGGLVAVLLIAEVIPTDTTSGQFGALAFVAIVVGAVIGWSLPEGGGDR